MRRIHLVGIGVLAAALGACEGGEERREGQRGEARGDETAQAQVVRSDTMACAMSGNIFNNRGAGHVSVHLTVENKCSGPNIETIGPPYQPARVRVLDAQGAVVNGQDYTIPAMQTDDSRLSVPAGARIELQCARGFMNVRHGCIWSYTYSP